ncbi:UNKNOWN [Stylonychia lemnae]|uniref:Uncharacterized protein n=1 Tax=Stylonychia lemnae TaxID=5949 RepID=A0A077ZRK4_STYLE|nr:UNKNOWN [Stylonychia lemnae]|eukprot:CDW72548.1 UNKNOWN [Stylonychia lemnae]
MKGQRTPCRFGMKTNKSIKYSSFQQKTFKDAIIFENFRPVPCDYKRTTICDKCKRQKQMMLQYHEYQQQIEEAKALKNKTAFVPSRFTYNANSQKCKDCEQTSMAVYRKEEDLELVDKNERKRLYLKFKQQDDIEQMTTSEEVKDSDDEEEVENQQVVLVKSRIRNEKKRERRQMKEKNKKQEDDNKYNKKNVEVEYKEKVKQNPSKRSYLKVCSIYHNHETVEIKDQDPDLISNLEFRCGYLRHFYPSKIKKVFPRLSKPEYVTAHYSERNYSYKRTSYSQQILRDKRILRDDIKDCVQLTKMGLLVKI